MLALDFINVGNGDSILIRELENGQQRYALMVDFGHDCLVRDDHPGELDPRSQRIYAGDFLRELGVERLDMALTTHFHRDHIGGLGRVLDAARVGTFVTTYLPPPNAPELEPDEDNGLPKAARNALRCVQLYTKALQSHSGRIERFCCIPGTETVTLQLTPELKMDILCGEPALYRRQREVYDAAYAGERNGYDLIPLGKIHECVLSAPAALLPWPGNRFGRRRLRPCVGNGESDALRYSEGAASWVPCLHLPEAAGASAAENGGGDGSGPAAGRAAAPIHRVAAAGVRGGGLFYRCGWEIPGLVEPEFHRSVHLEVE